MVGVGGGCKTSMKCARSGQGEGVRRTWDVIGVGGEGPKTSMGCGRRVRGA